ncbi:MAG TPA: tetraacyldisaccharide 4'-kinase [Flavobacteriaceae bacterium]|nr:tetraacyldisaccharide 4'-kinase [Flavobacteriaceae bacterium]
MKLLRNISFPFVPVYYLVTWTRNKMYDLGIKKSKSYAIPVICVGNLSVGGTGKTPMIEYLIRLLKDNHKVATLSRGYKRKTSGFQIAAKDSTVESVGDEPFQFYNKFRNEIIVAVDSDRQNGIESIQSFDDSVDIILLDDALQHRKVQAGLNILLTTYGNLYVDDFVLPTGNLREPKTGAKRADIIVVTKCPKSLSDAEKNNIIQKLKPKVYQNIFFSSIQYSDFIINNKEKIKLEDVNDFNLVTGIANANPLVKFLKSENRKFEHFSFKDHHKFSENDILQFSNHKTVITTEKDFMRLQDHISIKENLYYLPIEVSIDKPLEFNSLLENFVE